jgi:hypothetical protein
MNPHLMLPLSLVASATPPRPGPERCPSRSAWAAPIGVRGGSLRTTSLAKEGGCPGVIWADYLCDNFVNETQKKELKLLRAAMGKMNKGERE